MGNKTELNASQMTFLLDTARRAISFQLQTGKILQVTSKDKSLLAKRGAFVTLKSEGHLRGCIGYPWPVGSLLKTVIDAAVAAATQDFRFQPVEKDDLEKISIEISVLSRPEPVSDVSEIIVGKHGIIVSKGNKKGLLLPQVPVEWGWDLETFLGHGCLKAGLPDDAWKKGAKIERFSAQVFSDKSAASR